MKATGLACWVTVLFGLTISPALAEISVERLSFDSGGPHYLAVHGEFTLDDRFEAFFSAVAEHKPAFVVFDSPGGSIYSAMALGRIIRALQLNTFQIRELECSSACSLAFVGGVTRLALPGSIGVHRHSFSEASTFDRDEAVARIQETTADVLAYLAEMGVDAGLLQFALRYDQSDMRYLSASEMASLGVTNVEADEGTQRLPDIPPAAPPKTPALTAEQAAVAFVQDLVSFHSHGSHDPLSGVSKSYAAVVAYFGKELALAEVMADKRQYFERWPERIYDIREESLSVSCVDQLCNVTGLYDWSVRSLPRNRQASGTARFRFMVAVGQRPLVLLETSEVIGRR